MPADPNVIEATEADEPYEPSVAPPKPDRAAVLTRVRVLAAQVQGLAGAIEQAAQNSRMRTDFIDAWRRWHGSIMGWHIALERLPFHADDVIPMLKDRERMLQTWRQGFQTEMNPAQAQAAVGAAQPQMQQEPIPEKKPGILSTIPWWVLIPAGLGVAVGGYYGMRWIFQRWFGAADEHVQNVRYITEVVQPGHQPSQQQQQPIPQPQQFQQPVQ
jgi:hypothetical protein